MESLPDRPGTMTKHRLMTGLLLPMNALIWWVTFASPSPFGWVMCGVNITALFYCIDSQYRLEKSHITLIQAHKDLCYLVAESDNKF